MELTPIAHIENDFPTKFGLPRQSGMAAHLTSAVVMEPPFRVPEAFRGIEDFEYLWLIWLFEPMGKREWSPTVRPPKLGGNKRMGVFATRSPNRPNPIGLTRVRLLGTEHTADKGVVLTVSGADLMNGTAILDIKPYLPFADSVPGAKGDSYGSTEPLDVAIPPEIEALFDDKQLAALKEALAFDPRPGYQDDPQRVYGFAYAGYDVRFQVKDDAVTVLSAEKIQKEKT
jgi:tRNA-Thr(GGU) m(6)t(6)A37 methyltransferase TsaA